MQKISIDPELWARTRRRAFDTQTTASKIVAEALAEYLEREDKPRASMATPEVDPKLWSQRASTTTSTAVLKAHGSPEPIARVTKVTETPDGVTVEAERITQIVSPLRPEARPVITEPTTQLGAVLVSKEDAAAKAIQMAAAKGVEFHPVPKPVRRKR